MTDIEKTAEALNRLMDGLVRCSIPTVGIRHSANYQALETLCEAMRLAPPRLRVHLAKRLLDLEVSQGVETPLKYREEVGRAVQGIPTELDHIEPFRLHAIDGGGEDDDNNNSADRPATRLRLVKE